MCRKKTIEPPPQTYTIPGKQNKSIQFNLVSWNCGNTKAKIETGVVFVVYPASIEGFIRLSAG